MHSLYIDSTSGLVIGLLDQNFNWVSYQDTLEKKPSEIIHYEIYNLVNRHGLKMAEMNFFFSAGPGSYTGMRLGEGMAQIFDWDLKQVYSFYHFDVPILMGIRQGFWATNAFKGQVFLYSWDEDRGVDEKTLVNAADFKVIDPALGFTQSQATENFLQLKNTKDLIKESASVIFPKVFEKKWRKDPYYFRTLEEEFK